VYALYAFRGSQLVAASAARKKTGKPLKSLDGDGGGRSNDRVNKVLALVIKCRRWWIKCRRWLLYSAVRAQEVAVGNTVADYLIEQSGIDWSKALASWSWLLPPRFTLWMVNRFADLILVLPDGTVHMLDVGGGTLTKLADNRDDFGIKIDEDDNANLWLMIPLVDQMVAAGVVLQPGQCYGFKTPPVLGGDYTVENAGPLPVWDYLGAYGSIHEQLRAVPDGCQVTLNVVNKSVAGPEAIEE
jgi:hypothetical protein